MYTKKRPPYKIRHVTTVEGLRGVTTLQSDQPIRSRYYIDTQPERQLMRIQKVIMPERSKPL